MITLIKKVFKSSMHAFAGIQATFKSEHMFGFYLTIMLILLTLEILLKFELMRILFTIVCTAGILSFELINTGVERTVDALGKYNELTKFAKDAAAGSVAMFSITSIVCVLILFVDFFLKNYF